MSEKRGYVKLHRKLLDSRVWKNDKLFKLWVYCLLKATHRPCWVEVTTGRGKTEVLLQPGQFIFGSKKTANDLGQKWQSTYKRLVKLKNMGNLKTQNKTHYTLVTVCNWDIYQGVKNENENQNENPSKTQVKHTIINKKKKNIYIVIFDHWNTLKIIQHRKLTNKIKTKIKSALRDFSEEGIIKAIDNYSTVLLSDEYFFDYRWTLEDFLDRGLAKFVEEADPLSNFLKDKNKDDQIDDDLGRIF